MVRKRRPTQADIALAAGVSPAVVSLVINGRADGKIRISKQTQDRVWQAVRALDYVPNLAARQLAGGRNHLLGVFTFESAFPVDHNNFYYPFLVGIEQQAEALRYDLMLFTRSSNPNGTRSIYRDGTNALQVTDGSVLLGGSDNKAEIARLRNDGYPFVYVGRREVDGEQLTYVAADYASATAHIVHHIASFGHRSILYLGSPIFNESASDRETGFRRAMGELGLPLDNAVRRIDTADITPTCLREWLAGGYTAFVTEAIPTAYAMLDAARHSDMTVPHDFSLAALGNTGDASQDVPWITNFLIPRREMGAGAVELLHAVLTAPESITNHQPALSCTFQPGRTVGPAKS
jgi:DNA-binding LacI/PurR family transcriptional regulator